jgi:hypothetical protein
MPRALLKKPTNTLGGEEEYGKLAYSMKKTKRPPFGRKSRASFFSLVHAFGHPT